MSFELSFHYPENGDRADLRALVKRLVIARKYLQREDFLEDLNCSHDEEWEIKFEDRTSCNSNEFDHSDTLERDDILEKMVRDSWKIKSPKNITYLFRNRFRTEDYNYKVSLYVKSERPPEKPGFFEELFPQISRDFFPCPPQICYAESVGLFLNVYVSYQFGNFTKPIQDNVSKYKKELKAAVFGTSTTLPTIQPAGKTPQETQSNHTQPQTQIPNPWDAKIPTVENILSGGR